MKNRKLRLMRVEFMSTRGSNDYILGRISCIVDIHLDEGERPFIMGDTMHPNVIGLRFWATDVQFEEIIKCIEKMIPTKMVNIKCYNVKSK